MTLPIAGNRGRRRTQVLTGLKLSYATKPVKHTYHRKLLDYDRTFSSAPNWGAASAAAMAVLR